MIFLTLMWSHVKLQRKEYEAPWFIVWKTDPTDSTCENPNGSFLNAHSFFRSNEALALPLPFEPCDGTTGSFSAAVHCYLLPFYRYEHGLEQVRTEKTSQFGSVFKTILWFQIIWLLFFIGTQWSQIMPFNIWKNFVIV